MQRMEPLLIVSRDAQPDVLHRTPLERELAIAEGQADLLRRQILDGFLHLRHAPSDRPRWTPWILRARGSLVSARARARQLRSLLHQEKFGRQFFQVEAE